VTAVNGISYIFTAHKRNYISTSIEDDLGCHPVLISYDGFHPIPLSANCDEELLTWGDSSSGEWIIKIITNEDTYWETIYGIPGKCLLEHPEDIGHCQEEKQILFEYQGEFSCIKDFIWLKKGESLLLDQTNNPYFCTKKGVELIEASGKRINIMSHPGSLKDDLWTSDGQWVIWYDGSVDVREWGLYSPYDGGKVKYLGQGVVFDFSIIQVP
jgi:hypothetical protein